jgi:hypothetical protein
MMEKATKKQLGEELRKRYLAPGDMPEAMKALLKALRDKSEPPSKSTPCPPPEKRSDPPEDG